MIKLQQYDDDNNNNNKTKKFSKNLLPSINNNKSNTLENWMSLMNSVAKKKKH